VGGAVSPLEGVKRGDLVWVRYANGLPGMERVLSVGRKWVTTEKRRVRRDDGYQEGSTGVGTYAFTETAWAAKNEREGLESRLNFALRRLASADLRPLTELRLCALVANVEAALALVESADAR
jgi:hypothetical protein